MKCYRWLPIFVVLVIAGCANELPADKKEYVGLWKNNEVSLLITQSGRLEYENKGGAAKTSISAPIKAFTDRKITAGLFFFTTDFVINRPPREEHGVWSMVIDGRELVKAGERGSAPQEQGVPALGKIREMVTKDLRLLDKGIKANDFSDFIDDASMQFQSQISNDKMRELYKKFVEKKIDVASFMVGDFVLTSEPSISPNGVLSVKGKYLTKPVSLKFVSTFVYADPDWKTLGIKVSVGKD
jgi:hypothetical protein